MPKPFQDFAANLTHSDLPVPVLRTLRRSFLDTMGVAAVASTTKMAEIARQGALALFGVGQSGGSRILMHGACQPRWCGHGPGFHR